MAYEEHKCYKTKNKKQQQKANKVELMEGADEEFKGGNG